MMKTSRYRPGLFALFSVVFVAALLAHEYLNGGVRSHHLLDRRDLPAISNWFGLVALPVLGWLLDARVRNHRSSVAGSGSSVGIGTPLVGSLLYGAALAASFELGVSATASGLFLGLFLLAVVLPIYRAEYIFGFVVGMTFTFGGVLPVLVAGVVAAVSALAHFAFRAARSAMRARAGPSGTAEPFVRDGRRRGSTPALDCGEETTMNTRRIVLGIAVAVVFGLVTGALMSLANLSVGPVVQSVAVGFLGTAVGAFIARRSFVFPALGLWFVEWLVVAHFVYRVAEPTGQASVLAMAQLNLPSILLSALAVVLGALLGQALARRLQRVVPAT